MAVTCLHKSTRVDDESAHSPNKASAGVFWSVGSAVLVARSASCRVSARKVLSRVPVTVTGPGGNRAASLSSRVWQKDSRQDVFHGVQLEYRKMSLISPLMPRLPRWNTRQSKGTRRSCHALRPHSCMPHSLLYGSTKGFVSYGVSHTSVFPSHTSVSPSTLYPSSHQLPPPPLSLCHDFPEFQPQL
jgi:hypothetical protein